jgi:hypothetical protein
MQECAAQAATAGMGGLKPPRGPGPRLTEAGRVAAAPRALRFGGPDGRRRHGDGAGGLRGKRQGGRQPQKRRAQKTTRQGGRRRAHGHGHLVSGAMPKGLSRCIH